MNLGTATVLRGDARALPLPDNSVDLIVISPPYLGLRQYEDDGRPLDGQVGAERSAAEYLDALLACTEEWCRVLKPSGSLWINLGDRYAPDGTLMLLPERYRIAAVDKLGLLARAVTIWHKPRGGWSDKAPDRVRRNHEDWVHLTRERRYFADLDSLRTVGADYRDRPQYRRAVQLFEEAGFTAEHLAAVRAVGVIDTAGSAVRSGGRWSSEAGQLAAEVRQTLKSYYRELCGSNTAPRGRTPGSVWTVPTTSLKTPPEVSSAGHFAAFPPNLIAPIVTGWSPVGGVVLDPMGGTGTTAMVAKALGRLGITIDLSADYCRIATWRANDPRQLAKAGADHLGQPLTPMPVTHRAALAGVTWPTEGDTQ